MLMVELFFLQGEVMNQILNTFEVPKLDQLAWLQWQLANDFLVEREISEIWFAIYNDAGRHHGRATEAVRALAEDRMELAKFAQSLNSLGPRVIVEPSRSDHFWLMAVSIAWFAVGVAVGILAV